jgi:hypothetical protein
MTTPVPESESAPPPPGTAVRDTTRDRVGVVMGHVGPYLRLRPLSGGREWDVDPRRIQPLTPPELLRARLAEVNERSRAGIHLLGANGDLGRDQASPPCPPTAAPGTMENPG